MRQVVLHFLKCLGPCFHLSALRHESRFCFVSNWTALKKVGCLNAAVYCCRLASIAHCTATQQAIVSVICLLGAPEHAKLKFIRELPCANQLRANASVTSHKCAERFHTIQQVLSLLCVSPPPLIRAWFSVRRGGERACVLQCDMLSKGCASPAALQLGYGADALLVCRLHPVSRRPSGVDVYGGGHHHVQRRHHHGVALPSLLRVPAVLHRPLLPQRCAVKCAPAVPGVVRLVAGAAAPAQRRYRCRSRA